MNCKFIYFKGFGKYEDMFINGRGLNEVVNLMDLNFLKDIGVNFFRIFYYFYFEEMMCLVDWMGVLVIDEVLVVGLF